MGGTGPGTWRTSDTLRPRETGMSFCEENEPNRGGSGGDMRLLMSKRFLVSDCTEAMKSMPVILLMRRCELDVSGTMARGRGWKAEIGCEADGGDVGLSAIYTKGPKQGWVANVAD
jgi:hypothetical protein